MKKATDEIRAEYTDDVGAAIVRLQMIREDFAGQVARINRTIDDLKRAREMARAIGGEQPSNPRQSNDYKQSDGAHGEI